MNKQWVVVSILFCFVNAFGMEAIDTNVDWKDAKEIQPSAWHVVGQKYKHIKPDAEHVYISPPVKKEKGWQGTIHGWQSDELCSLPVAYKILYSFDSFKEQNNKIIYPVNVLIEQKDKSNERQLNAATIICSKGILYITMNYEDSLDLSQFDTTEQIIERNIPVAYKSGRRMMMRAAQATSH